MASVDNSAPLVRLCLHGHLRSFGALHRLVGTSAFDVINGLAAQHDGFQRALMSGHYRLLSGPRKKARWLRGPDLFASQPHRLLHLIPATLGAGKSDSQLLLGITLLGLAFLPGLSAGSAAGLSASSGSTVAGTSFFGDQFSSRLLGSAGAMLLLGGASEASRPASGQHGTEPALSNRLNAPTDRPEGQPIPLIYGRVRVQQPPLIASSLFVETQKI
ncbi:MAG: hypothetical protein ACON4F_00460 [Candidatus Puniceispirillaceae bacterium]